MYAHIELLFENIFLNFGLFHKISAKTMVSYDNIIALRVDMCALPMYLVCMCADILFVY